MLNVVVNSTPHIHQGEGTVASLLKELGMPAERVAVMVSDTIVPRDRRDQWPVIEGDRIEILTFMGGG